MPPVGREVIVNFCYFTADAQGMNMIVKATEHACQWIMRHSGAQRYYLFSGLSTEKRASGSLFAGGKGKKVTAGARLPARIVQAYLHTTPEQLADMWHHTMLGHVQANALGYNGHYANGLTALFIACGQDVANVANAAVGITNFEVTDDGRPLRQRDPALAHRGDGRRRHRPGHEPRVPGDARLCRERTGGRSSPRSSPPRCWPASCRWGRPSPAASSSEAHETYGRNRPSASVMRTAAWVDRSAP